MFTFLGLLTGNIWINSGTCCEINVEDHHFLNTIISQSKQNSSYYNSDNYKCIFGENLAFAENGIRQFCLEDGIIIQIPTREAKVAGDKFFYHGVTISPRIVTAEFQNFTATEGDMKINFKAKQIHGKNCKDKFANFFPEIAMGILKNKNALIKEGLFIVKTSEFAEPNNLLLTRALFQDYSSLGNNITIRYWNPDNQGNDYGIFIKNKEAFSLNYGSEDLFCKFTVEQVKKDF